MRRLSWQAKLLFLFAGILAVSLLFQLLYVIPTVRAREIELVKDHQEEVARSIARELNVDLLRIKDRLGRIAERPEFRHMDLDAQKDILTQHVEISRLVSSLYVMDAKGIFISTTGADLSIYTTQSYADRPYFAVPFEQGQVHFSPATNFPQSDLVFTSMSVPIVSDTGERCGVLVGAMHLNKLIDKVADYPLDEGTVAYVVDSKGVVVAHSGIDLFALEDGPLSLDDSDRPLVQEIMAGSASGFQEYEHEDIPYYGTYSTLESNGWGVIVEAPSSLILAESAALTKQMLLINLAALVASLVFTERVTAERRRAEKEIHRLSQFQQGVIDNVNVWLDVLDRDANVLIWNKAAEEISGYSREEVVGHGKIWPWLYPDAAYREEITAKAAAIIEQGEVVEDFRTTIRRKDGQSRIISWHSRDTLDEKGFSIGSIAIGRDITEQLYAQEALRDSEAEKLAILNGITTNIAFVNQDLEILWANKAAASSVGKSPDEIIGHKCHTMWGDPEKPCDGCPTIRAFETKSAQHAVMTTPDGRVWDESGEPVLDVHGNLIGVVEIARDITEKVRLEEQLRQAAKLETVGRLAGGVAHSFNNLLTVINGYSQSLLLTLDPEHPLCDDISEIYNAGTRAAKLTNQLLSFGRRQMQQVRVLDLNEVVREATKRLLSLVSENITLEIRTSGKKEYVEADPGQIDDAIINLVINARDAMPQGGVLTIEVDGVELDERFVAQHPDAEMGQYVMLAVSDTGIGMTPEVMEHIFEPFFTTKEVGKGTGLGLPSVYGTAKQSGGSIHVDSEPGEGTTFRIYLPRVEETLETDDPEWQPVASPTGTETILVVEDSDQVRKLAVRMLRSLGYTALEASRGSEALDICRARSEPIDLLLIDVILPEIGSQEIAHRLCQECAMAKESLILYVSGYPDGIIDANVDTESGIRLLRKPFSIEALAEAVRQTLDRTNSGQTE